MERSAQPSLLAGFDLSSPLPGIPNMAEELPVARVVIDSPVPHLDRPFDYLVPAELDEAAQPGVRVKVRFGGQELAGLLAERLEHSDPGIKLQPLRTVVSPEVVLSAPVLAVARAVAERYAGGVWDVLRSAVPARMARVETEKDAVGESPAEEPSPHGPVEPSAALLSEYHGGADYAQALRTGGAPRAVLSAVPNRPGDWPALLLEAAELTLASGRGVLIVVPDARDLTRLCATLDERIGEHGYARLSAEDGATPRYRNFLRVARGNARLVVGTRNAAFAPVKDLGLAIIWDDADNSHAEPRAPYHHAREVLLLRCGIEDAGLLLAAPGRSAEAQRLIRSGWAAELVAERKLLRAHAPRVIAASDEFEADRDPMLHAARLPAAAWREAKAALAHGPVLVQVARTGFMPALRCERCRTPARCTACNGPLALDDARGAPACGWCGLVANPWNCVECGFMRLRAASIGADRTAEELGRAFPHVKVVAATGAKPLYTVPATPALVVATPGAEPVAQDGYAAVLLLDGDRMMAREGLRTGEEVLNRWMGAAHLARGRDAADGRPGGGTVVVAGEPGEPMRALVRFDAAAYAEAELDERRTLGLPPAVRTAMVKGPAATADKFMAALEVGDEVRRHGPVLLGEGEHRWLLFFSYAQGPAVTAALRALRATFSAAKEPVVSIRIDPDGIL
ncbi:primosomal protein N' family DNA-binding protein [Paeniglutamicibacter sulfureus]|uniref:Probable replication restart protein PriA n=1 Tax=Paeniglutamicibacter sulfureus TaxID=43666 RepID=A0ABU2BD93_9MICC|nr:primosomal protein PriA [Paeniglutamicibacter sulfureus]MDR7356611.1 primosomal protein N' (replication factor Y) [Paeniglutamicibacter sulfureus]